MRLRAKGGISVLLAWLTVFLLVLSLVLAEAGRGNAVRYLQTRAGNTAAESMTAGYNRLLFHRYGLLFYDGGMGTEALQKKKITAEFRKYFLENAGPEAASFLGSTSASAALTDQVGATDYHGELFVRSALAFYKYEGAVKLLEKLREQLERFGEGEKKREETLSGKEALEAAYSKMQVEEEGGQAVPMAFLREGMAADLLKEGMPAFILKEGMTAPILRDDDETTDTPEEAPDPAEIQQALQESVIGEKDRAEAKGIMKLVLPEGKALSDGHIERHGYPSWEFGGETLDSEGFLKEAAKKVVFNEYLLDHFPCFTTEEQREGLQYELEYILYGSARDQENLKTVVNRLMWMREGMNLLHLSIDEEKRSAAEGLAESLVGWTGQAAAVLVPLATAAILIAWAYGESLVDVRTLLSGGRVPIIKSKESWSTELSGLKETLQGGFRAASGGSGMSYRDYLRILLLLGNSERHTFYAMDMIQMNLRKTVPGFTMQTQLYAMEFTLEAENSALFTAVPLFRNLTGGGAFTKKREYHFSAAY